MKDRFQVTSYSVDYESTSLEYWKACAYAAKKSLNNALGVASIIYCTFDNDSDSEFVIAVFVNGIKVFEEEGQ